MASTTQTRPPDGTRHRPTPTSNLLTQWSHSWRSGLIWCVGLGVLVVLVPLVSLGPLVAAGVVAVVLLGLVVVVWSTDHAGVACLCLAYLTAPAYKGLASSPDAKVTPTDALLVLAFALLVPTLLRRPLRLPVLYLVGSYLVLLAGGLGSLLSVDPVTSLGALALWLVAMLGLPAAMAWWNPTTKVVDLLVWSYVLGHCISTAYAVVQGPVYSGRYLGLTTHPNYFGEAGMLSIALLLHQWFRTPRHRRWLFWLAMAVSGASVFMSGSRAATAVVVVLLLLVPVVERSPRAAYVVAVVVALGAVLVSHLLPTASPDSALGRLSGQGSATGSDASRSLGLAGGWERFLAHPLSGSGLLNLFDIHNNFLEVLVGAGVIGLLGYLLVLWSLSRGLFSHHELHRLAYVALAYVGFGATIPSLNDRSIWTAVALAVLVTQPRPEARDAPGPSAPAPAPPPATGGPR